MNTVVSFSALGKSLVNLHFMYGTCKLDPSAKSI